MSADFVVLGLGSNLNLPIQNLRNALAEIKKVKDIQVKDVSSIYESEAQVPNGADASWNKKFLNAAVLISVSDNLKPIDLLLKLKQIEKKLGRINAEVWAPRLIDIDILYWNNLNLTSEDLNLPHLRLSERPFALLPLLEVFPKARVQKPHWASAWVQEKPFATKKSETEFWPKFLGILNLTDDSFSDGGQFRNEDNLIRQAQKLVADGADILDLGAESTRPGAQVISTEQEFESLKLALTAISKLGLKVQISIDSYKPQVIEKCLNQFNIDFINDVTGLQDERTIDLVKKFKKKVFVMHSLSVPAKSGEFICNEVKPTEFLNHWWQKKRQDLLRSGLDDDQLIFDPGIGFGTSARQSLYILDHLQDFSTVTNDILIGHSRKSYQTLFSDRPASARDPETALITQRLNLAFTQYLRVHDVKSQAIALRAKL